MARRLTTNQEIAGSIPASIKKIPTHLMMSFLLLIFESVEANSLCEDAPFAVEERSFASSTVSPGVWLQHTRTSHDRCLFSVITLKRTQEVSEVCWQLDDNSQVLSSYFLLQARHMPSARAGFTDQGEVVSSLAA